MAYGYNVQTDYSKLPYEVLVTFSKPMYILSNVKDASLIEKLTHLLNELIISTFFKCWCL